MSHKIKFSTTCQDFGMTAPEDIASIKCGDTSISFLSRTRWFMAYKTEEDANKQNIQQFLEDDSNTFNVCFTRLRYNM